MEWGGFRKGQYHRKMLHAQPGSCITPDSNRLKSDVPLPKWVEVRSSKERNSEILRCPTIFLNFNDIKFSPNDVRRKIRIPKVLTKGVAEDIGIQVGDGSLPIYIDSKNFSHYVIGTYGHKTEDRKYFEEFVIPLKKSLFGINLGIKNHKTGGTCYLKIESKALFFFYHKTFGLPHGKKSKTLEIPKIIRDSGIEIRNSFLRGVADTDFSLTFKKNCKIIHSDPMVQLGCASRNLVLQIEPILTENRINSTLILDEKEKSNQTGKTYTKHYINIHGKKNLEKWMNSIGFHNPVQYSKYLIWKKFGFCPPRTTLDDRIKILNGVKNPYLTYYQNNN